MDSAGRQFLAISSDVSGTRRVRTCLVAALLVVGFAALYALTAQRGVSWGDSGWFQLRILENDLSGTSGLALAHPLFVSTAHFVFRLVPEPFRVWSMNAICGIWGALAVGMMFLCAQRFARSTSAAVLAALTIGCAHMFWWLSTMSEVYTLSVFLLACEIHALLVAVEERRPRLMFVVFFANGLHFSDHNFALLSLPVECFAACWLAWRRPRVGGMPVRAAVFGIGALLAWCGGAWPILSLAWGRYCQTGSLGATAMDVLVGAYGAAVAGNMGVPLRVTLFNYALAGMSFALPCWFFAVKRLFMPGKKRPAGTKMPPEALFVAAIFLAHFLFWVRYRVSDQATFLLPTLFMAVLLAAPAFGAVKRPFVWGLATVAVSVALPNLVAGGLSACADQLLQQRGQLPFRDDLRYFACPWKHNEDSAAQLAAAAARELPRGAFVYIDATTGGPLACAQRLGLLSPDIRLSRSGRPDGRFTSVWEIRPVSRYRLSPPEAKVVRRGTFCEVILPQSGSHAR